MSITLNFTFNDSTVITGRQHGLLLSGSFDPCRVQRQTCAGWGARQRMSYKYQGLAHGAWSWSAWRGNMGLLWVHHLQETPYGSGAMFVRQVSRSSWNKEHHFYGGEGAWVSVWGWQKRARYLQVNFNTWLEFWNHPPGEGLDSDPIWKCPWWKELGMDGRTATKNNWQKMDGWMEVSSQSILIIFSRLTFNFSSQI